MGRRAVRSLSGTKAASRILAHILHHADTYVFRHTGGRRIASNLFTGLPVAMLTTTGAKSGKERTLPLLGILDGEDIIVVASGYGEADIRRGITTSAPIPKLTLKYTVSATVSRRERSRARSVNAFGGFASKSIRRLLRMKSEPGTDAYRFLF